MCLGLALSLLVFTLPDLSLATALVGCFLALLLSRLVVIDLCYLLLPNIYVFPLLFTAPILAPFMHHVTWQQSLLGIGVSLIIGVLITTVIHLRKRTNEIGMGDIKLLLVLGAWLGAANLPLALAVSCFVGLGLSFLVPRGKAFPFGPALIIGLWVGIFYIDALHNLMLGIVRLLP